MAYMQIKLLIYLILSVFKPFYMCPSFATTLYVSCELVSSLSVYVTQQIKSTMHMKVGLSKPQKFAIPI